MVKRRLGLVGQMVVTAWVIVALAGMPAGARQADREEIRSILVQAWNSIETLEVEGEEFICDDQGRRKPDPGLTFQEFSFAFGSGGRRAIRTISVKPDGRRSVIHWIREDGRRQSIMTPFEDDSDAINMIRIRAQEDGHANYQGPMNSWLWLWTPNGRPLHVLLDEGADLEMGRDEEGREVAIVTSTTDPPIRCELDPAHDWLPRRVTLVGSVEFFATEFARENGVWMPVEGWEREVRQRSGVANTRGFQVTDLRVNRPLTTLTFAPPEGLEGVLIQDEMTGEAFIPGGEAARERLMIEHRRAVAASAVSPSATPMAPRDPPTTPWGAIVALLAVLSLALAAFLKFRRLQTKSVE